MKQKFFCMVFIETETLVSKWEEEEIKEHIEYSLGKSSGRLPSTISNIDIRNVVEITSPRDNNE